jgi:hypothetical protein
MKIAFLCSGLEQGRDGVGDYTRRLAAECIRQGHPCVIASLNDTQVSETVLGSQESEGTIISLLRLPSITSWNKRKILARNWLDAINPTWASLQFVPFGFHRKGLCAGLGKRLADISPKSSWHIMFHELWLGLGQKSPVKHRFWGALQRRIIMDMLGHLRPQIVHTQTEPYREVLIKNGIQTTMLPLFSNIRRANLDAWDNLLKPLIRQAGGKHQNRSELYLAGIFGAVHPEWDAEQTVNTLFPLVQHFRKRLVLVFHGKNNLASQAFSKMKAKLQNRAEVVIAGERTEVEISKILQTLDLGLATSPRQIIQKSGSVAAMLEHGLQVLVTRDDWRLRGSDAEIAEGSSQFLSPKQFAMLKSLPARNLQMPGDSSAERVAGQLLAAMESHLTSNHYSQP